MSALVTRFLRTNTPPIRFRTRPSLASSITTPSAKQVSNSSIMERKISEGEDKGKVVAKLTALLEQGWKLNGGQTLQKTYHFKLYSKVMNFHHIIGTRSISEKHHSEMITDFNSLTVSWTTHSPPGLSAKDTFMATFCDDTAKWIGAVDQSETKKCGPPPSSQN